MLNNTLKEDKAVELSTLCDLILSFRWYQKLKDVIQDDISVHGLSS